jgi:hypothetical protein
MVRSDRVSDKIMEAVDAFKKSGNLADELANQYILGFVPGDTKPGKWHNLKLTVKGGSAQKVTLRYRKKFFLFR